MGCFGVPLFLIAFRFHENSKIINTALVANTNFNSQIKISKHFSKEIRRFQMGRNFELDEN